MLFLLLKKTLKMANITLDGNPVNTSGSLPKIGSSAIDFNLVAKDLTTKTF